MFKSVAWGFVIAIATTVLSVLLFVALEPRVPFAWAFAPGFMIKRLFEQAGAHTTNRWAINATFLFWWITAVAALRLLSLRRL